MRTFLPLALLGGTLLLAPSLRASSRPQPRICVAVVANVSRDSAMVDRLTERLTKNLGKDGPEAISMESGTTLDEHLLPTRDNGEEALHKECDYVLLTQISGNARPSAEGRGTDVSIGGRVPSIDAADPLGGSSGPVYRASMQVRFAAFRAGTVEPVLNTFLLERASANVSDSFLQAMDREANRVSHEIKKKRPSTPQYRTSTQ